MRNDTLHSTERCALSANMPFQVNHHALETPSRAVSEVHPEIITTSSSFWEKKTRVGLFILKPDVFGISMTQQRRAQAKS
jgi:hypothetical protein